MKKLILISAFCLLMMPLYGEGLVLENTNNEAVFLKDGSILEGKILSESTEKIEFQLPDKTKKSVDRTDVLRILFLQTYKNKVFIYKKDNEHIQAYIVDEDATSYTYRLDLGKNEEVKIQKSEIKLITAKKITELKTGLKLQGGSGSLVSAGPTLRIENFEILFALGFVDIEDENKEKLQALPVKIQGAYFFLDYEPLRIYTFVSAAYAVGLKNYDSILGIGGGAGIELFEYLFVEGGYHITTVTGDFAIGFGINIPLKIF